VLLYFSGPSRSLKQALLSVENWVSLKPVLRGVRDVARIHYPSCTDSIKPSLQFFWNFVVIYASKGSLCFQIILFQIKKWKDKCLVISVIYWYCLIYIVRRFSLCIFHQYCLRIVHFHTRSENNVAQLWPKRIYSTKYFSSEQYLQSTFFLASESYKAYGPFSNFKYIRVNLIIH
jgi:hypothetical protein